MSDRAASEARARARVPRSAAALLALTAAAAPAALPAQDLTQVRASRQDLGEVRRLEVDLEYLAGELRIGRAPDGFLYVQELRYDASRFSPVRSWTRDGNRARLELGIEHTGSGEERSWLEDVLDLDLGGVQNLDRSSGELSLQLGPAVPTDLAVQVGAAESDLRLGGLPLTSFRLETGASEIRLRFGEPNPTTMERMHLKSGAASLRAERLGNARFGHLQVESGVGDMRLDFRGQWTRDAEARVNVGVGSLTLIFPSELGVEVHRSSFLTSVDAGDFRKDGSTYRSPNWSEATHRLTVRVESAVGTVDLEIRD